MFKVGNNRITNPYQYQQKQTTSYKKQAVNQIPAEKKSSKKNNILKYCIILLTLAGIAIATRGKHKAKPKITNGAFKYSVPTKEMLEKALKNVDLTNPEEVLNALRRIPGIKIKEGIFKPSEK